MSVRKWERWWGIEGRERKWEKEREWERKLWNQFLTVFKFLVSYSFEFKLISKQRKFFSFLKNHFRSLFVFWRKISEFRNFVDSVTMKSAIFVLSVILVIILSAIGTNCQPAPIGSASNAISTVNRHPFDVIMDEVVRRILTLRTMGLWVFLKI